MGCEHEKGTYVSNLQFGFKNTTKGKVSQIAPATLFCHRLLHISPQSYSVTPCDNEVLQSVAV